ncbi:hypothetical protein [Lacrimispora sp.]|nr:hypothetical protein [Lacrimispora sp.]
MEEITEEYLQRVPPVVCWYEGMIATKEFIEEYGEVELLWNNV